jgi:hypothetical protein
MYRLQQRKQMALGVLENWNDGRMRKWNFGKVHEWNDAPIFQYSIIPPL